MSNDISFKLKSQLALLLGEEAYNLANDAALISSGLLNSLKVVELASWVETNYHIDFAVVGFSAYDFESINTMAALIARHAPSQ